MPIVLDTMSDHDLLITLNTKVDIILQQQENKADRSEVSAIKEDYTREITNMRASHVVLDARVNTLWIWLLGALVTAVAGLGATIIAQIG